MQQQQEQWLEPDWEQFVAADDDGTMDGGRDGPPKKNKKKRADARPVVKKAPKISKVAKLRVGCYGCGADLQTEDPAGAGYVEEERYALKAQHRQLKLLSLIHISEPTRPY